MRLFTALLVMILISHRAFANSYVEMITTPPFDVVEENVRPTPQKASAQPLTWYDSRIKTSSPVVTSPYPKYEAYVRSNCCKNFIESTRDELQHLVYMVEGGLLSLGIYELYFRY